MAGVGAAFALVNLAREINCRVIATNLNQDRLRAVTGKVLSLTATLEENQEALGRLGANELDPVMDGLRAILDHTERLSRKMQKQGRMKRMFNATEIEHAIQALEREIDTEMNTVNLVCNFINHGNVHRMHHDLQSLRAEMIDQFSQLLSAHKDTQQSIAEIELPPVAQLGSPEAQINDPLQSHQPPLTTRNTAPDSLGLHGNRSPAPPRPTPTRFTSAPTNASASTTKPPARAQTQRPVPSTIDSDDEFDFEAELARSKASAAATIPTALPSSRTFPSAQPHPPTISSRLPHLELGNGSDLDSDLDSEGEDLWSERPIATARRYRPSAISVALTLPPPSNPRAPSPLPPSSILLRPSISPHPPSAFAAPQPPRIPSPGQRYSPPRTPIRPSTPPEILNHFNGQLHQSPERVDLRNLAGLSLSPPRPPIASPQPTFSTPGTHSRSQSANAVIDVLQVEPDDQEEPLPAFTEFDPLALEEQEQQQQQAERSRAGTSARESYRVDSPARRTPVVVEGDYKPDEFDPSMLARPGQPEEICGMCANLLPVSEYPSSKTTESCTHPINICLDCMRGYLHEEVIEHGRALQVRCPIPMCGEYLSCDEFKRLADHFAYTAYCDIIDGRRLPQSRPSQPSREFKPCPRELCGYIMEREGERGVCKLPDGCGAAFCWTCLADFGAIVTHGNQRHRKTCTWYRPPDSAHRMY